MFPETACACFFSGTVIVKKVAKSSGSERCRVRLRLKSKPEPVYVEVLAYGEMAKELDLCAERGGSVYVECTIGNIPHMSDGRKWVELEFVVCDCRSVVRPRSRFKSPNPRKIADILASYDPDTYLE